MILGTGAAAAGALGSFAAKRLGGVHAHSVLVAHAVFLRMYGAYKLVVQNPLVVVHVAGIVRIEAVKVFSELCQVVAATGFVDVRVGEQVAVTVAHHAGVHAHHLGVGLAEHFAVSDAAHCVCISALNHLPEVAGYIIIGIRTANLVALEGAHNHGNVLVGMTGADIVDIAGQRLVECRGIRWQPRRGGPIH